MNKSFDGFLMTLTILCPNQNQRHAFIACSITIISCCACAVLLQELAKAQHDNTAFPKERNSLTTLVCLIGVINQKEGGKCGCPGCVCL